MMSVTPPIITQVGTSAALPSNLSTVTSPLYPSQTLAWRLRSLPPETYDLRLSSHVVRLASVFLGETGPEQLAKRTIYNRLRETMSGSNFLDLDSFWGLLFSLNRGSNEVLPVHSSTGVAINPFTDVVDSPTWQSVHDADSSYRDRIFQFAQGVDFGASLMGIQLVAEAVLQTPCQVFENFQYTNTSHYTQFPGEQLTGTASLYEVSIIPYNSVSVGDVYNLNTVLNALKPAHSIINIRQMGLGADIQVPVYQAYASSSYWEVDLLVTPGAESPYVEGTVGRWAFSGAQGSSWSLLASVTSSMSQSWTSDGTMLTSTDFQHLVWPDGTYVNYTPDLALMDVWTANAGRLGQTGVCSANPVNATNSPSPVLVDGVDIGTYAAALSAADPQVSSNPESYWSTPARYGTDTTVEVAVWILDAPHLLTTVSMQVVNLPHQFTFDHLDAASGSWITDYSQVISPSVPTVYPSAALDLSNKINPAYDFDQAWILVSFSLANPVTTGSIRVTLTRIDSPFVPIDYTGSIVPYPLAVSSLNAGTVISDSTTLPVAGTQIDTGYNVFGDQVSYQLYETPPTGPIANTPTTWRCAPQPSASSVVNFYLDCRDQNGNQQVFDSLLVAPTQLGVTASLYQTTDVPPGGDEAVTTPLPVTAIGSPTVSTTGIAFLSGAASSLSIASQSIRFVGSDWWAGASWIAGTAPTYSVLAFGSATMVIAPGQVSFVTSAGTATVSAPVGPGVAVRAIVASLSGLEASGSLQDASGTLLGSYGATGNSVGPALFVAVVVNGTIYSTLFPIASGFEPVTPGLLVGSGGSYMESSGMVLTDLIVKGEPLTADTVIGFGGDPSSYAFPGPLRGDDTTLSQDAWIRFDPEWVSPTNPYGFVGGTPDSMSSLVWSLIPGQYVLTSGYMRFPPMSPTFIKIEMTNLAPELCSNWTPGLVETQVMGSSCQVPRPASTSSTGAVPPGVATSIALASGEQPYASSTQIQSPPPAGTVTPTQTLVSSDPATSQALASAYLPFGYVDWHQASASAMPVCSVGVEAYTVETMVGSNQIGFFCGFKSIQPIRSNPAASIDSVYYDETFSDTAYFGPVTDLS